MTRSASTPKNAALRRIVPRFLGIGDLVQGEHDMGVRHSLRSASVRIGRRVVRTTIPWCLSSSETAADAAELWPRQHLGLDSGRAGQIDEISVVGTPCRP